MIGSKAYQKKIIYPVNPVPELLSNEDYSKLIANEIINQCCLRNYIIRKEYKKLREDKSESPAELKKYLSSKYNLSYTSLKRITEKNFFLQDYNKNQNIKKQLR